MNYMLHFVSFQQRTVTNYLVKEKTEPFPKPTLFSKQKTVTNYFAKEKNELFPTTQASFRNTITSRKKRLNRSQRPKPHFGIQEQQ